ncbi:outer membrane protein [Helicobacter cetorum]|uniref:outer membrane protein n=1 Tax=Helicobacter cetorum TaxID=138563 RepID=UPI000CF0D94E|nr:outer membrane protein [Helicobacter cetorum]
MYLFRIKRFLSFFMVGASVLEVGLAEENGAYMSVGFQYSLLQSQGNSSIYDTSINSQAKNLLNNAQIVKANESVSSLIDQAKNTLVGLLGTDDKNIKMCDSQADAPASCKLAWDSGKSPQANAPMVATASQKAQIVTEVQGATKKLYDALMIGSTAENGATITPINWNVTGESLSSMGEEFQGVLKANVSDNYKVHITIFDKGEFKPDTSSFLGMAQLIRSYSQGDYPVNSGGKANNLNAVAISNAKANITATNIVIQSLMSGIASKNSSNISSMVGFTINAGYKWFFGNKKRNGVRAYGFYDYAWGKPFNQVTTNNSVYGVGVDYLYNFIDKNKLVVGAFLGFQLSGSSWSDSKSSQIKTLKNELEQLGDKAQIHTSYFQIPLMIGVRTNLNKHNGIELGVKIPLATQYYFKSSGMLNLEMSYKRAAVFYANYVYNF